MSDYPMLISNKLHSFRNFEQTKVQKNRKGEVVIRLHLFCSFASYNL